MDQQGKVVFITGGAVGIGEASATMFAAAGARVVVTDIADAAGEAVARRLGPPHRYRHLDVTDAAAWDDVFADPSGELAELDVAFLNAGVMSRPTGSVIRNDPLEWISDAAFASNVGVNRGIL